MRFKHWPTRSEIDGIEDPNRSLLALLRFYHHLPTPRNEDETYIRERVVELLNAADPHHLEVICKATGYDFTQTPKV